MIAAGRNYLDQWWIATFPGLAILSLTIAFNIVGDSLRDFLDPAPAQAVRTAPAGRGDGPDARRRGAHG